MKFFSNVETKIGRGENQFKIMPGKHNLPIDYKDPHTARQLMVLRKCGALVFQEVLDGYIEGPKGNEEAVTATERADDSDISGGSIQEPSEDESSGCSEIPERRDSDYPTKPLRRTRRKKKRPVEETD